MYTIESVKARLIDYLGELDLNKLSFIDLCTYTNIISQLVNMERPDPSSSLYEMMAKVMNLKTDTHVEKEEDDV